MSFILLHITVPEYWIVAALLTVKIFLLVEWFRSTRLSENQVITAFVNTIDPQQLPSFVPTSEDVKEIEQKLKEQRRYFLGITIRQALSLAVSERIPKPDIERIGKMPGDEFEKYVAAFFRSKGYRVEVASTSGEHGVGLIVEKEERKIAVQCKRYQPNKRVGNREIQEVVAGKLVYECSEAWVITTSFYTSQALEVADELEVRLIDRRSLMHFLTADLPA